MEQKEYLEKLHKEILEILDQVVCICKKHNLKYYMIGGTLLGAVRHSGFIPWDDDLDIVMPRKDFNLFIDAYSKELPSPYMLKWTTNDENYFQAFAKVYNSNTLFSEDLGNGKHTNIGIFVDVFPLDEVKRKTKEVRIRKWIISRLLILMYLNTTDFSGHKIQKTVARLFQNKTLHRLTTHLMSKSNGKGYSYYANFGSQYSIDRQTHPISRYGDGVILDFEDRQYCAPSEYKTILLSIFGNKYMDVPPVEKRRIHYPIKVIFSDGSQIEFEAPQKKLEVTDQ